MKQRAREIKQRQALGLPEFPGNATKPGTLNSQRGVDAAADTTDDDDDGLD